MRVESAGAGLCMDGGSESVVFVDGSGQALTFRLDTGFSSQPSGPGRCTQGMLFARRNRGRERYVAPGSGTAIAASVLIGVWIAREHPRLEADSARAFASYPRRVRPTRDDRAAAVADSIAMRVGLALWTRRFMDVLRKYESTGS